MKQTGDPLLTVLYLGLKDENRKTDRNSWKWGGYVAERKVINYVHLYGLPSSDEAEGFVKYLKTVASFLLHRH